MTGNKNTLSLRMSRVCEMLRSIEAQLPYTCVADIGCDHGFVSIHLAKENIMTNGIAADVNAGPLKAAAEHIARAGLSSRIDTRLSNGFEAIAPGEADGAIIAGLGGRLMIDILTAGLAQVKQMRHLVLQPQSEVDRVRAFLREHRIGISAEDMLCEDGKYYMILGCTPGEPYTDCLAGSALERNSDSEAFSLEERDLYGVHLLQKRHPVLLQYLDYREGIYQEILAGFHGENEEAREKLLTELKKIQSLRGRLTL